jgi:succinate dehydrogenase/fumarate reductase flavoprotein subunit
MSALFARNPRATTPACWLIADHRAQRRYGLGWSKPFPFPVGPYLRAGYLKRAATLRDLAAQCNLPADTLAATIARFNENALRGEDPDFQRGASAYNRMQGDADHRPNPSLGVLSRAPFYALRILPGSLGTFAGIRTAPNGQALDEAGAPIPGLYAVGNDAASIMGGNYPSGGITLGPGMTFGYVVGRVLAGRKVAGLSDIEDKTQEQGSPS